MSEEAAGSVQADEPEQDDIADTEAPEADEVETAEADAQAEGEGEEGDGGDDPEDAIEFDFGGNKVRVAKDVPVAEVAEQLREYTESVTRGANEKFQQAAEVRKVAEAERQSLAELSDLNTEALEAYAAAASIRDRIAAIEGIDLNRLWQSNPDQARRASDELTKLRNQQQAATAELDRIQGGLKAKRDEMSARAIEAGKARVAKLDPDFARQADDVVKYVTTTYGIPEEQAKQWPASPEIAVMARKAMLYDRAQTAGKKQPPRKIQEAAPVRSISGKGGNARPGPRDGQSVDAWMRERNKQVAKRAAG